MLPLLGLRGDCGFILAWASASSGARHACSVRALSANRGARPLVPRRRNCLEYPASVMFTGAMFGSTRVTYQPSAHSAATAASVGASSLTMQPSSMVPRCEAVFPSERKEEKCYLEDRMKTVFVSTFIRALAANECVFVWLLHSGRASKAQAHSL